MKKLIYFLTMVFIFPIVTLSLVSAEMTYSIEQIYQLPLSNVSIDGVRINNQGEVVWYFNGGIYSNIRGEVSDTNAWECCPAINDSGQIAWQTKSSGYYPTYEVVLDGTVLTNNSTDDWEAKINNQRELIWTADDGIRSNTRGLIVSGSANSPEINNNGEVVYQSGTTVISTV